jgi:hypothetical protein
MAAKRAIVAPDDGTDVRSMVTGDARAKDATIMRLPRDLAQRMFLLALAAAPTTEAQ